MRRVYPTIVVEKWMREGFNIMTANTRSGDCKEVKDENLEAFLTTEKSV